MPDDKKKEKKEKKEKAGGEDKPKKEKKDKPEKAAADAGAAAEPKSPKKEKSSSAAVDGNDAGKKKKDNKSRTSTVDMYDDCNMEAAEYLEDFTAKLDSLIQKFEEGTQQLEDSAGLLPDTSPQKKQMLANKKKMDEKLAELKQEFLKTPGACVGDDGVVGGFGNKSSKQLEEALTEDEKKKRTERFSGANDPSSAQQLTYVRSVRAQLLMARNGKDVRDFRPERDVVLYDITEAERDVTDLRRQRRQVRILFGQSAGVYKVENPEAVAGQLADKGYNTSLEQMVNDTFNGNPAGTDFSPIAANVVDPATKGRSANLNMNVVTGKVTDSGSLKVNQNMADYVNNTGPNWALEVVKASENSGTANRFG